eukprot:5867401-Prymnesium_polylepis.2
MQRRNRSRRVVLDMERWMPPWPARTCPKMRSSQPSPCCHGQKGSSGLEVLVDGVPVNCNNVHAMVDRPEECPPHQLEALLSGQAKLLRRRTHEPAMVLEVCGKALTAGCLALGGIPGVELP